MRFNPPPDCPVDPGWVPQDPDRTEPLKVLAPDTGAQAEVPSSKDDEVRPPEKESPPAEAAGPQKRGMWTTAVNHPMWTTLGALVGIIGLVISVVQIVQSMQTPPVDLEVAALTADNQQSVHGVLGGGDVPGTRSVELTPIDLTLQNKGGEPALITRIDAKVVYFQQLADCSGAPPSPETIAAKYHLAIPMSNVEPVDEQLTSEIRFEVKPGTADRMVFTLGPQTQPAFDTTPMVLSAKIKLIHDGDQVLDVGTVSLVTTVQAAMTQIDALGSTPSPQTQTCARQNLEHLDKMFEIQATRSRILDGLRSAYQRAAG